MQRRFFGLESPHHSEHQSLFEEAQGSPQRQALTIQPEVTAVARPGISVGDYFVGEKAEYVDITVSLSAPGLQTVQVTTAPPTSPPATGLATTTGTTWPPAAC
jgi:hypothetical protein